MTGALPFALNHMVAPQRSHQELFDLAVELGLAGVEIRNDLDGVAIQNGVAPSAVREDAASRNLSILTINALQRFNEWNQARAEEAKGLADYARSCGARGLVLCPVNDRPWQASDQERLAGLRLALEGLAPILSDAGIVGLVEPLGFAECSLRLKREAVAAIDDVGVGALFRLVHDTFHHRVAGETAFYPDRTGIVHISGVVDGGLPVSALRDPHRVLVDERDHVGNLAQIKALLSGGYHGALSFEPFAKEIHDQADIRAALARSMEFMTSKLRSSAAA